MRILVEVGQTGPEVKHLIEQYGAVVAESRGDRLYVLEICEPEADKRRVLAEEISWSLRKLEGVRNVFIPGYRTLWRRDGTGETEAHPRRVWHPDRSDLHAGLRKP